MQTNNYILKFQYYCKDLTPEAQAEDCPSKVGGFSPRLFRGFSSHSRGVFQPATGARGARARIFKCLWGPGIDSKE
jgi:hypothetical protein